VCPLGGGLGHSRGVRSSHEAQDEIQKVWKQKSAAASNGNLLLPCQDSAQCRSPVQRDLAGGSTQPRLLEPDWLRLAEPLPCLSRPEDPMCLESSLVKVGPPTGPCTSPCMADLGSNACTVPKMMSDCASRPPVHAPSLVTVLFPESTSQPLEASGGTPIATRSTQSLDMKQPLEGDFINTTRWASPGSVETGVIPICPDNFVQLMSKPLQPRPLASPPIHH
jgi:hypothetical protein